MTVNLMDEFFFEPVAPILSPAEVQAALEAPSTTVADENGVVTEHDPIVEPGESPTWASDDLAIALHRREAPAVEQTYASQAVPESRPTTTVQAVTP